MKLTKDHIMLITTAAITLGFLLAGIFNVLDFLIVKALLFGAYATLLLYVIINTSTKSSKKENHQP